ncbi:hypothetical protein [Micromonospora costi]|uniref:Uncharacterized protein n=1 Tax=Micromonospora costi TaxID=1530042 RepID=A0A3B0AA28_9ACTN|nr:hypothetical protein [Micromonospora costi]RKN55917.1 hypothetical protein D7193_15120 [Micromonospora costi]
MAARQLTLLTAYLGAVIAMTITFAVQKVIGVVAWSWWLVLSPLLIAVGAFAVRLAVVFFTEFAKAWKEPAT